MVPPYVVNPSSFVRSPSQLTHGQLVEVDPSLVKRCKQHIVSLPFGGLELILGRNGYIWLSTQRVAKAAVTSRCVLVSSLDC